MRRVKRREGENLSDSNIKQVIQKLNSSPAITKKQACEMLNISYNTSRLNNIIEEFNERQQFRKLRKSQLRGRPATKDELKSMIEMYLDGDSFAEISKATYRSIAFVKAHLDKIGVPQRVVGEERQGIEYLPDECVSEEFQPGEIAWSARYHAPCEVIREETNNDYYLGKYASSAYQIWVKEPCEDYDRQGGFFASQLAYDLGKLEHLKDYGINTSRLN